MKLYYIAYAEQGRLATGGPYLSDYAAREALHAVASGNGTVLLMDGGRVGLSPGAPVPEHAVDLSDGILSRFDKPQGSGGDKPVRSFTHEHPLGGGADPLK